MAVSLPQIIQFPIQYLLCERDHKISWKCLDCNLLMCTACERNIYSKFDKTSRKHRLISIKDIGNTSHAYNDYAGVHMTVVGLVMDIIKGKLD